MREATESLWLRLRPYLTGLLTGMALGSLLLWGLLRLEGSALVRVTSNMPPPSRSRTGTELLRQSRSNAIVNAVDMTRRSVVTINAVGELQVRSPLHDLLTWPARRQRPERPEWIGSGFLIDHEGNIVTTEHVVRDAHDLGVSLGDGTSARARVVGTAPRFDLALLHVDIDRQMETSPAILGDSDDLMVGEWAIAIGSPFGNQIGDPQPSVSVGVISAVHRDLRPLPDHEGVWPYFDLLQTDAAINAGNSGGPLVNSNGEVIGVNMAVLPSMSNSRGMSSSVAAINAGVNFSIPMNTVKWVIEELREYGEVRTPWVGWQLGEAMPEAVRRSMNLAEEEGVLVVVTIEPGSPAARAGIGPGDVVFGIDGQNPYSRSRADRILFHARVGGPPIRVDLFKGPNGQQMAVMLDVAENPKTRAERLRRTGSPS
jgi:serine protease Do